MTTLVEILTVPAVRRKFARRLGIVGIAVGVVNIVILTLIALGY